MVENLLILAGVGILIYSIWQYFSLRRSLVETRQTKPLEVYPSLTVIRPIKGLDCEARENIRSALTMEYPRETEIIFVLDDRDEPALPILKEEITAYLEKNPSADIRILFCGEPPRGCTGKLNAMIQAYKEAKGEAIAFVDSDIRPEPRALTRMVEALYSEKQIGAAFGQVIVASKPRTVGDVGYALLLNGFYMPSAYYAAHRNNFRFEFIMGQMMALKREGIEAIGGLESVQGQLVDDMYIGKLLYQNGYENVLSPVHLPIVHHSLDIKGFWKLYLRWISFGRSGLPGGTFKRIPWIRGVIFGVGAVLAALGLGMSSTPVTLLGLAIAFSISISLNRLHVKSGGVKLTWKQSWISLALVLVSPLIYLGLFTDRKVVWRGRSYKLDIKGQLAATPNGANVAEITERRRIWRYVAPDQERRKAVAA